MSIASDPGSQVYETGHPTNNQQPTTNNQTTDNQQPTATYQRIDLIYYHSIYLCCNFAAN
jgi:hypothetical protein